MKRIILLMAITLLIASQTVSAQTYCYKYLYSTTNDGVKTSLLEEGLCFHFTFTNNKDKCYLTNKDGVYDNRAGGQNTYKYIGTKNGMLIYKEYYPSNMFRSDHDLLYFSSDYSRLNWKSGADKVLFNSNTIRVLQFTNKPDEEEVPTELY